MTKILLILVGVFALWLFLKIFSKPMKWVLKLLLNALVGFVTLFIVNYLGGFVGLHITVGWVSALVTGFLGVPGIILLLLIENMIL